MARTALTTQQISRSMLTPAYSAGDAANGHSYPNSGQEFIIAKTTGTGATLTIKCPTLVDGNVVADKAYTLPATGERQIGPFPANVYNQADGNVYIDLSSATGLTLGVFRSS